MTARNEMRRNFIAATAGGIGAALLAACGTTDPNATGDHASALAQLEQLLQQQIITDANLAKFDELDFDVFTNQKWDRLHESHGKDIVVHWPDGRETVGIDVHIEDLEAMFVWAPDTRIETHPIRIGSGEWTAVTGVMEGTFTAPMPIGDGKVIEPTGKSFGLTMATVGHWKDGVMDEEWLFWDNGEFMRQIGLAD